MSSLLTNLNTQFRMKDLGELHYFLGMQAQFHSDGLFVSQQKYAEDLLALTSMTDCAPMPTPLPLNIRRSVEQGKEEAFPNPT